MSKESGEVSDSDLPENIENAIVPSLSGTSVQQTIPACQSRRFSQEVQREVSVRLEVTSEKTQEGAKTRQIWEADLRARRMAEALSSETQVEKTLETRQCYESHEHRRGESSRTRPSEGRRRHESRERGGEDRRRHEPHTPPRREREDHGRHERRWRQRDSPIRREPIDRRRHEPRGYRKDGQHRRELEDQRRYQPRDQPREGRQRVESREHQREDAQHRRELEDQRRFQPRDQPREDRRCGIYEKRHDVSKGEECERHRKEKEYQEQDKENRGKGRTHQEAEFSPGEHERRHKRLKASDLEDAPPVVDQNKEQTEITDPIIRKKEGVKVKSKDLRLIVRSMEDDVHLLMADHDFTDEEYIQMIDELTYCCSDKEDEASDEFEDQMYIAKSASRPKSATRSTPGSGTAASKIGTTNKEVVEPHGPLQFSESSDEKTGVKVVQAQEFSRAGPSGEPLAYSKAPSAVPSTSKAPGKPYAYLKALESTGSSSEEDWIDEKHGRDVSPKIQQSTTDHLKFLWRCIVEDMGRRINRFRNKEGSLPHQFRDFEAYLKSCARKEELAMEAETAGASKLLTTLRHLEEKYVAANEAFANTERSNLGDQIAYLIRRYTEVDENLQLSCTSNNYSPAMVPLSWSGLTSTVEYGDSDTSKSLEDYENYEVSNDSLSENFQEHDNRISISNRREPLKHYH